LKKIKYLLAGYQKKEEKKPEPKNIRIQPENLKNLMIHNSFFSCAPV